MVFVILLGIGPMEGVQGGVGLLMWGMAFIGITAHTTLPAGALAGVAVHGLFRIWPAPGRSETTPRPFAMPVLRALYVRALLSMIPLLLLVGLLNRSTPRTPGQLVPAWRIVTELCFFPVLWIEGLAIHFELPVASHPEIGIALRIAWAFFLSVMLFRLLTRLAFRG